MPIWKLVPTPYQGTFKKERETLCLVEEMIFYKHYITQNTHSSTSKYGFLSVTVKISQIKQKLSQNGIPDTKPSYLLTHFPKNRKLQNCQMLHSGVTFQIYFLSFCISYQMMKGNRTVSLMR